MSTPPCPLDFDEQFIHGIGVAVLLDQLIAEVE
jgi:hypothetical protein